MPLLLRINTHLSLVLILSFLVFSQASSAKAAPFETKAQFAMLYDMTYDEVLYEKEADTQMEPSSMTKVMTAYIVFDKIKKGKLALEDTFPVSVKAWKKGGSKMFVKEGDEVTVEDLLKGIIVQSGNDACIVIAEGIAGSEEAFADEMNYRAKKIGMTGSYFKNSSGWPDTEHVMTARDLVVLTKHTISDFPEYYHYYSQPEFTYADIKQINRNKLLYRNIGVDGLKTGFTSRAGYGIVISGEQEGRRLILVVNGLASSKERASEAERLLRHGYRDFKVTELYKKGTQIETAEVWLGAEDTVPLIVDEDVRMLVGKQDIQDKNIELKVEYRGPIPAPIPQGLHIADLIISKEDKELRKVPLVAGKEVDRMSFFKRVIPALKYHFGDK